jgi:hypothetical protein
LAAASRAGKWVSVVRAGGDAERERGRGRGRGKYGHLKTHVLRWDFGHSHFFAALICRNFYGSKQKEGAETYEKKQGTKEYRWESIRSYLLK